MKNVLKNNSLLHIEHLYSTSLRNYSEALECLVIIIIMMIIIIIITIIIIIGK